MTVSIGTGVLFDVDVIFPSGNNSVARTKSGSWPADLILISFECITIEIVP